jgi:glycosyltransferase involved in cell wall biosynthesis
VNLSKSERPVVLVIDNSVDVTGALKSITYVSRDLAGDFTFKFVLPVNSRARQWLEKAGSTVVRELPLKELSKRLRSVIIYIPVLFVNALLLRRLIKSENVSLLHVNDLYDLLPVVLCAMGSNIRYVCHVRFLPSKFPPWLFQFWLRLHLKYAKRVVIVSKHLLQQLPYHPKLELIYSGLPVKEEISQSGRTQSSSLIFLYLANFMEGKGQHFALEAFAGIRREVPNARLRFVGSDMGMLKNRRYKTALMESAKELGLWEQTEWLEFVNDVEQEYKNADVFLNFSESESFSMTCAEALYYGCPVIATRSGGPAEVIDDGCSGILVSNGNVREMKEAMLRLSHDLSLRRSMSKQGRELVRKKFSFENTSERVRSLYREILWS